MWERSCVVPPRDLVGHGKKLGLGPLSTGYTGVFSVGTCSAAPQERKRAENRALISIRWTQVTACVILII